MRDEFDPGVHSTIFLDGTYPFQVFQGVLFSSQQSEVEIPHEFIQVIHKSMCLTIF